MKKRLAAALAACTWACILACMTEENRLAGPCTETGNPSSLCGRVVTAAGQPSAGASVTLFRLAADSDAAPQAVAVVSAGSGGGFNFGGLAEGTYALGGRDSAGSVGLLPRAVIPAPRTGRAAQPLELVLKAPAVVTGKAKRGRNPRPAGVAADEGILVRLIGTDRFAFTDSAGDYRLEQVAEGVYDVLFAAADGHYLPRRLDSVRVAAGVTRMLPTVELEWSPFVDPPAPAGLRARPEAGLIRLAWEGVRVSNLAHYELRRGDPLDAAHDDTAAVPDTAFADTVAGIPAGRELAYSVRAVNRLGNRGPWSAPVTAAVLADTVPSQAGISALSMLDGSPAAGVELRLYRAPAAPGSPDSLPLAARLLDSALTGADGRARFAPLLPGSYTVWAREPASGRAALRSGLSPRLSPSPDTLALSAPGALRGTATRQRLWVTTPFKLDENIQVTLAGAPFTAFTEYDGAYRLAGVPPGTYAAVFYALPEGYFLPDTQTVTILPGDTLVWPKVAAAYNPSQPPPKPGDFRLVSGSRNQAAFAWSPINGYPFLKGYEVLRMDTTLNVLAASGVISGTGYTDDVSGVATGTRLWYVVRALGTQGKASGNAGGSDGQPLVFDVP